MTEVGLGQRELQLSPRMRRWRVPAWRSSTRTGSATRPAPRRGSIRTSGAGTRRASRSRTRTSTRRAPRPSCARCSRGSGATACCRTSVFTDGRALLPRPRVLADRAARRTRPPQPRTSGIVQPPVHATAVWQVYRNAADRRAGGGVPARADAEARRLARLPLPRAHTRRRGARRDLAPVGVGHATTRRSGTRRSRASRRRRTRSPSTSASTPRSSTRRSGRRTRSTTATPTSSSCYRERGYDQAADPGRVPVRDPGRSLQLDPRAGRTRTSPSIARVVGEDPEPFERAAATTRSSLDAKLWSEASGMYLDYDLRAGAPRPGPRPGAASRRSTAASSPRAGGAARSRPSASSPSTLDGGWAVPSVSARRSLVRPGPLLARAGVAHDQLGHLPRPPPPRLRRGGGAAAVDAARARPRPAASGSTTTRRPARGRARSTCPGPPRSCSTSYSPSRATRLSSRASVEKGVDHASESARSRSRPSSPCGALAIAAGDQRRRPIAAGGRRQRRLPLDAVERDHRERGLPQPRSSRASPARSTRSTSRSGTRRSSPTGSRRSRTPARARSACSAACTATSPRSRST